MRHRSMRPGHLLTAARVAITASVFASAALVVEYQQSSALCTGGASCAEVRASEVGKNIGDALAGLVPWLTLPHVGLFASLVLMAITFFLKGRLEAFILAGLSGAGALFAGYLIYAQVAMDAYCPYCVIVDVAMIVNAGVTAVLALVLHKSHQLWITQRPKDSKATDPPQEVSLARSTNVNTTIAWGIAGTLLTALPFIWARYPEHSVPVSVPPQIAEIQEAAGKPIVITFTDFQCPFCRKLHEESHDKLHDKGVEVRRIMVPLPMHPGALPAALGYLCTPTDKREEIADALYKATDEELTFEGVVELMRSKGLTDVEATKACFIAEDTKSKLEADSQLFDDLGVRGLPTTWVGSTMVRGAQADVVISAVDNAAPRNPLHLPVWLLFVAAGVVILGVVVWTEVVPPPSPATTMMVPPIGDRSSDEEDDDDDESKKDDDAGAGGSSDPRGA